MQNFLRQGKKVEKIIEKYNGKIKLIKKQRQPGWRTIKK